MTRWAAEKGAEFGLPADRLMLLDESAGGNLAAVVALMASDAGAYLTGSALGVDGGYLIKGV